MQGPVDNVAPAAPAAVAQGAKAKPDISERDEGLKRLKMIGDYFGSQSIFEKSDFNDDQCTYLALVQGYSELVGGLPGIDESLAAFARNRVSRGRKGRLEFVEAVKAGNTSVPPTYYPMEGRGDSRGLVERLQFWKR